MYKLLTIEEDVRIPPVEFGKPKSETLLKILRQKYEGQIDKDAGVMVAVTEVRTIGQGFIQPGNGSAIYPTQYDVLVFKPELNELVDGNVLEIVEFGAFVNLGALDGLVHVSQVTDDFLNYDEKGGRLIGKESKKFLAEGDKVRARIVAISLKKAQNQKVGLTMRQPGLGKHDWLEEKKKGKPEKKEEKKSEKKKEEKK